MEYTASVIAEYLGGEVEGNPEIAVTSFARIEQGKPGQLCFLANPKYEHYLYTTKASIVLVNKNYELKKPVECTLIRVEDAYEGIASLLELFQKSKKDNKKGRSWRAKISWSAKLGKKVYVGAFAYIGKKVKIGNNVKIYPHVYIGDGVTIGDGTILYSGVKIYHDCVIGANCILHAGAVLGSDGFGFAPLPDGGYKKIPQLGNVVIEDDVEIGANTAIDRATMGSTIIKKGVKLDNLIQVAHNVFIDESTVMAAQVGVAGSTKVGKYCMIGGQAGFGGHNVIGDRVIAAAQTGIIGNVKDGKTLRGSPGIDLTVYQRSYAIFKNLSELRNDVFELKKQLTQLNDNKSAK
ncbi:MAG: UDP-3-O-(3-hydroxymyristoyl)glucosamine N-acyltransferase [Prevotellaceae bacterium]|jgi:UDP-3-O-[3-hydroxymyristoyl] glucosamine N-acyltransferase|nr:UDP-3-O-(3-hydroxymyristoyl)glucosamine N-acyltransferase [Prevotellaceae bacterium]